MAHAALVQAHEELRARVAPGQRDMVDAVLGACRCMCKDIAALVAQYAFQGVVALAALSPHVDVADDQFCNDGQHWWTLANKQVHSTHFAESGVLPTTDVPWRWCSLIGVLPNKFLAVALCDCTGDGRTCLVVSTGGQIVAASRVSYRSSLGPILTTSPRGTAEIAILCSETDRLAFFDMATGVLAAHSECFPVEANTFFHLEPVGRRFLGVFGQRRLLFYTRKPWQFEAHDDLTGKCLDVQSAQDIPLPMWAGEHVVREGCPSPQRLGRLGVAVAPTSTSRYLYQMVL